jgi:hypothetical protein
VSDVDITLALRFRATLGTGRHTGWAA